MTIYAYSIPAILALIAKVVILYFSQRAEVQDDRTVIFRLALVLSIAMNVGEVAFLQKPFDSAVMYGALIYYAAHIPLMAFLVHLAISISVDNYRSRRFLPVYTFIYGYALALEILLLFTSRLIEGIEDFNGYTATRVPGPLFWLYELFMLISFAALLSLPIFGLSRRRGAVARPKCKLRLALGRPLAFLVVAVLVLLHFKIRWFNATVTAPLLIALFLAAVGYATHKRRIIELDFYIPWSRTRKGKIALYQLLAALAREIPKIESTEKLLSRFSKILGCPVFLVGRGLGFFSSTDLHGSAYRFPKPALNKIHRVTVADEIRDTEPEISALMKRHRVAAIVPFFPHSQSGAFWLLFGEPFGQRVYTPLDFRMIEGLFGKMAGMFLDKMIRAGRQNRRRSNANASEPAGSVALKQWQAAPDKPLEHYFAEVEAEIIENALKRCNGNQAQTARLLGLRPNTLHYKLKRYGLA